MFTHGCTNHWHSNKDPHQFDLFGLSAKPFVPHLKHCIAASSLNDALIANLDWDTLPVSSDLCLFLAWQDTFMIPDIE
eukprot:4156627-Ditylum_brightwellii.AAC.1